MKKLSTFVIIVLLAVIALAVTKPDRDHFRGWIDAKIESEPGGETFFNELLEKGLEFQASQTLNYEDHVIYATVETTIGDKKVEFLGIAGNWFKVAEEKLK